MLTYCEGNVNAELNSEFKVQTKHIFDSKLLTDLTIVEGDSWQKFLSIIPVTSRLSSLPPILSFKEENWPYIKDFINYQRPKKILIVGEDEALRVRKEIDWKKITAFHLKE